MSSVRTLKQPWFHYAIRAQRKGYEVSTIEAMMDMVGLNGEP